MGSTLRFAARCLAALTASMALSIAHEARAALTTSEQAQVDSFVAEGKLATVARVRALVARTDLSTDESAAALKTALAPVPWSDARAAYVRDLLFGGSSQASRPVLAVAITRAVLGRADALLTKHATDLDAQAQALAELARIYAFLDAEVANAGNPRGAVARDAASGITTSSYDECVKAIAEHLERHPRWLKGDQAIPAAAVPARAQAQLALFDMMNDGPSRRVDAADKLGLTGPRRAMLTESGMLLLDASQADGAKIDRVRAIAARFPGARGEVEALYFGEAKPKLSARGAILGVKTPLEASAGDGPPLFPEDVEGAPIDASLGEVARALATVAVHRALDVRPELRAQAERDVRAAAGDPKRLLGTPADASAESALAAAAQLLAVDAPRAIDVAMVRLLVNRPESAAILSDALGALAAYAPSTSSVSGLAVPLGKPRGEGGATETIPATNVRLAPAAYVTSFVLAGHTWALARDDAGAMSAKRDGAPLTFAMLPTARMPATEGTVWSNGGVVFAKMQGTPKAGVAGPHVRLVGTGARGFDAIATPAPGDDVVVECDAAVRGEVAIAVRAISGRDAFKGVALVIAPGASVPRASIRTSDELGHEAELAPPVDLPASPTLHVKIVVKGSKIEATVGGVSLKATVPPAFAHGDVALAAKHGAAIEATAWSVRRP
jgi:hypothetical protein